MSVKSTRYLTRSLAVSKWAEFMWIRREEALKLLMLQAATMSDTQIEDELERLNDAANGGEGFENYTIRDQAA